MAYESILFTVEEGIATLTFNRPDKLNALNGQIADEITTAVEGVAKDDKVKVLILTGAGRSFCSGGDLSGDTSGISIPGIDPTNPNIKQRGIRLDPLCVYGRMMRTLKALDKPVLGAINGFAVGAGLSLAAACDIRIASENAKFGSAFVRIAISPDTGLTYFLPRLVGVDKALELIWTGDIIDAEEAKRIGLVGRVVPHDKLMPTTRELANRIAKGPSIANEFAKRLVYYGLESDNLESQLVHEAFSLGVCFQMGDYEEGIRAFREKRQPIFKGR